MTRRLFRSLALLAAAVALCACATATLTRLAYNNTALAYSNLGPMLTWMVEDYVDLTGGQEDWVRGRIDAAVEWHRTRELPRYRAFLESALAKSAAPFTTADLASHRQELRGHYRRMLDHIVPDVAEFLGNLDAGQVAQLERKFESDNRKYVKDSVSGRPEERLERRVKRFAGHLEAWVGPLTDEQRALVVAGYPRMPDLSSEFLAERRLRQVETLALLRAGAPREQLTVELRKLLVDTESWRRPELAVRLGERDRRLFETLAALSATLSPAQRAALQARIRGFLGDITTLTASN